MATYSSILPGKSHGQKAWQATVLKVARVRHDLETKLPPNHTSLILTTTVEQVPLNLMNHLGILLDLMHILPQQGWGMG